MQNQLCHIKSGFHNNGLNYKSLTKDQKKLKTPELSEYNAKCFLDQ